MIRGILALVAAMILTGVLGALALVASLVRRESDAVIHLGRLWSAALLFAVGARPRYHGLESVGDGTPRIFASNHASVVDIWVLLRVVPSATRFVAKDSLFRTPILGWALRASGFVPIDRGNRARAMESLRLAAETIRRGRPVVVFPEGTRSRDGRLLPFKKGAFHLALEAGVPIVPVTVRGSFERVRPRSLQAFPGPVDVFFDEPIDVTPYLPDDVDGLLRRVRGIIAARLGEPAGASPGASPAAPRAATAD